VSFDLVEKPVGTLDLLVYLLRHGTANVEAILAGTGMNRDTYQRAKARLLSLGFTFEEQQADNLAFRYLGLTRQGEAFARALAPAVELLASTARSLEAELDRLEADDQPSTARRRLELLDLVADREYSLGLWDSAFDRATRLAALAHGSEDTAREARGRVMLGRILQKRDRPEEAVGVLSEALRLADASRAYDAGADAEYLLGAASERRGDWVRALERFDAASDRAERFGDPLRLATTQQGKARLLARQGRAAEAHAILREVVATLEAARADEELPRAYASLGSAAYLLDRPDAVQAFEKAVEAARRAADPRIEAHGLTSAAAHWIDARDFRRADAYLRRARTIFADLGERSGLGAAELNTANLLGAQDAWTDAEGHYAEALRLARETGDRFLEASALMNEGQMMKRRDRRNQAVALLTQARGLFAELGSVAKVARCDEELGELIGPGTR